MTPANLKPVSLSGPIGDSHHVTMTFNYPSTSITWDPDLPTSMSKAEWAEYFALRDKFAEKIKDELGFGIVFGDLGPDGNVTVRV